MKAKAVKPSILTSAAASKIGVLPPKRPIVIFDMAFLMPGDDRFPVAVTGAALPLALRLRQSGIGTEFLAKPLIADGEVKEELRDQPLIFVLTLYDKLFTYIPKELALIKEHYPQAKVVIGGPSVTSWAGELADLASFFPEADALVRGEGEFVLVDLVKVLTGDKAIDQFSRPGVYIKDVYSSRGINIISQGEFAAQPPLISFAALVKDIENRGCLALHTSRGCPYRCVFCAADKLHNQPIFWESDRIINELLHIKGLIDQGILPAGARKIHFDDDDFFFNRERSVKFLTCVKESPALNDYFVFSFQGGVRSFFVRGRGKKKPLVLDKKLISLLKDLRVVKLFFGTDGFCDALLKQLRKPGYNYEMVCQLARALVKAGISQNHYAILTTSETTFSQFFENLINITALKIELGSMFLLTIIDGLRASDSSLLRDQLIAFSGPDNTITSSAGVVKRLPLELPVADEIADLGMRAVETRLVKREIEAKWLSVGNETEREVKSKIWEKILPIWDQIEGITLRQAMHTTHSYLQEMALLMCCDRLMALMEEAGFTT